MQIQDHIKHHIQKRLQNQATLVFYDPEQRFREIVLSMSSDTLTVIDGRESTILGRERAMQIWRALPEDPQQRLLIYLPIAKPVTDKERRRDPYTIFCLDGNLFPRTDAESFRELCLNAAPDRRAELEQLFTNGLPDLQTINHVLEGGANWPTLKTVLKAESAVEILTGILVPNSTQQAALQKDRSWHAELEAFCQKSLGYTLQAQDLESVQHELWRFILFSEFVFDLPESLPGALLQVPHASDAMRPIIYSVCDTLRSNESFQEAYMQQANHVADELQLEKQVAHVADLGERDTFSFEERTFLNTFARAVLNGQYDVTDRVFTARKNSLWVRHTAERHQLWIVADRAVQLCKSADDLQPMLGKLSTELKSIFDFYTVHFRRLDRLHRNFEQAVIDTYGVLESLDSLVHYTRQRYATLSQDMQALFVRAVQQEGWPTTAMRNNDVFAKKVAPWLESRSRVALFMVDALRYELAVELENELASSFNTTLTPVCAQLPTVTAVGMASLLPGAETQLKIDIQNEIMPFIGDHKIKTPADRLAYTKSIYGDRCAMSDLDELLETKKITLPQTTQLWLIKTTDIDTIGEASPYEARRLISGLLRKIRAGIHMVQKQGFDRAVIATDHGFLLLHEQAAGDVVSKPSGDWAVVKDRCLLGHGSSSGMVLAFSPSEVGISTNVATYAVPKTFAAFAKGKPYYHEGLSLQECVLPVLEVDFEKEREQEKPFAFDMSLSYKKGNTDRITTRRPMIEIALHSDALFEQDVEFQLEAYSEDNEVVGEVAACEYVNPETNLLTIKTKSAVKVPLKMLDEFQGAFQVRAFDPNTKINFAVLDLQTDYMD